MAVVCVLGRAAAIAFGGLLDGAAALVDVSARLGLERVQAVL